MTHRPDLRSIDVVDEEVNFVSMLRIFSPMRERELVRDKKPYDQFRLHFHI